MSLRRCSCAFLFLLFELVLSQSAAAQQPKANFYRTDYLLRTGLNFPNGLLLADLNHDGKLDVAAGSGQGINIALGNGDGTFQPVTSFVPSGNGVDQSSQLASTAADFDGDGNLDLVLYSSSGIVILPGRAMARSEPRA